MTPQANFAQATFAAALRDPDRPCPSGLRAWNGSDPAARFAVYRNNVVASLIDALADTFPVVQELVGPEFFRAMAGAFVRRVRPCSPMLTQYGEAFPVFIEAFEHARPVPYLADIARLEFARVQAYHAADAEPVAPEAVRLALASGDRMGQLRSTCHPSLAVIASPFAVVSVWAAHQGQGDLAAVDPDRAETAVVVRPELEVLVLRCPVGGADFVAAIRAGVGLGDAAASATRLNPGFDLSATLALLIRHGALTSIRLPPRPVS
jgi:hypothetical protein